MDQERLKLPQQTTPCACEDFPSPFPDPTHKTQREPITTQPTVSTPTQQGYQHGARPSPLTTHCAHQQAWKRVLGVDEYQLMLWTYRQAEVLPTRRTQPAEEVLDQRIGCATDTRYSQGRMRVRETFPVRLRRSTEKNTCSQQAPVRPVRPSMVCAPFRFRSRSIFRSTDSGLEGCLLVDLIVPLRSRKVRSSMAGTLT